MKDKVVSHRRFLQKMERDLDLDYRNGDYASFISKFRMYSDQQVPEISFMEKFYEALSYEDRHDEVMEYALLQMNEGAGNYDVHMHHLLKSLLKQERYFEVIEFSDHLMEEDIPQRFRIDVAAFRHEAKRAMDEKMEGLHAPEVEKPVVSSEAYRAMQSFEKIELLRGLIENEDIRHRDLVRGEMNTEMDYTCLTFMLLYLRTIEDRQPVVAEKMDAQLEVVPAELPTLEESPLLSGVRPLVMDEVENRMPEFREAAEGMLMSHAVHCYPIFPPFDDETLYLGYMSELFSMLNLDHDFEADASVIEWIRKVEGSMM
ncbi:hypothetical protein J4760_03925 [Salinicoccus sp. ID82-1]|uniref:DUF3196 domain-containing protein n=1 Tax=Salinicoccus cyprini TaxID=2493691 RepID=A0A558AZF7_9STAP|nr:MULTISPECIES: hypothetical protein [Salinicoccus]MCG1009200.1 hypothetical protein [Salinicoccus sp. ID82-1]TVT29641.1 hypothetical protein FO441_04990 [Salinicoccus cyprini]